jgi:uncharacterized protein YutE (UPF0331/DUF86 family)
MNDVFINKAQSIQRCIERAREEHQRAGDNFAHDYTRQDSAVLNITRACEQAIDLANYVIKSHKMGIPTSSDESFELLARKGVIGRELREKLQKMVGFRNIAVHEYQKLDIAIVEAVIRTGLDDLMAYTEAVGAFLGYGPV